jgi:hypothetical protein
MPTKFSVGKAIGGAIGGTAGKVIGTGALLLVIRILYLMFCPYRLFFYICLT